MTSSYAYLCSDSKMKVVLYNCKSKNVQLLVSSNVEIDTFTFADKKVIDVKKIDDKSCYLTINEDSVNFSLQDNIHVKFVFEVQSANEKEKSMNIGSVLNLDTNTEIPRHITRWENVTFKLHKYSEESNYCMLIVKTNNSTNPIFLWEEDEVVLEVGEPIKLLSSGWMKLKHVKRQEGTNGEKSNIVYTFQEIYQWLVNTDIRVAIIMSKIDLVSVKANGIQLQVGG